MPDDKPFNIDPSMPVSELLKQLRLARGKGIGELAESTGLSRLTVSAVESQKSDARISSLSALFDKLGYVLLPVPKNMAREVANFVNNGGVSVSLPAGQAAPMGAGQRAFHLAEQGIGQYLKRSPDEKSTRVGLGIPASEVIRKVGTGLNLGGKAGDGSSLEQKSTRVDLGIPASEVIRKVGTGLALGGKAGGKAGGGDDATVVRVSTQRSSPLTNQVSDVVQRAGFKIKPKGNK